MNVFDVIGRTVIGVDQRVGEYSDAARIWFDDGSALELSPTGYEADGIDITPLSPQEFAEVLKAEMDAALEQARREREAAEARRKWLALTCEERRVIYLEREAQRSTEMRGFTNILDESFRSAYLDLLQTMNRSAYGNQPRKWFINEPCSQCGERECYNAPISVTGAPSSLNPGCRGCPVPVEYDPDVPPGTIYAIPREGWRFSYIPRYDSDEASESSED